MATKKIPDANKTATPETCPECHKPFEQNHVVVAYRVWPGAERLGHFGCVKALARAGKKGA